MAARENQGLQIALIAFVMLTILLGVSTYLLFSKWQDTELKMKDAQGKMAEANTKQLSADADVTTLKTVIGADATEDVAKIKTDVLKSINDQTALGLNALPDADKNQRKVIGVLTAAVTSANTKIEHTNKEKDDQRADLTKKVDEANAKLTAAVAARDTAVAELDKERAAYKAAVDALKATTDQLVAEKSAKDKQSDAMKADYEQRLATAAQQVVQANKDVERIKGELKKYYHLDPSATGGVVTWINQRENMAYINLGWDDGLHRRISFSVYPPSTTDVAKAVAKGKIEVINVTGPHLAEARIIENPTNNPLLPGDIIHTQGWHPGQHEHFAIAGMIDIDGAGLDQTKKLHDLILANGGLVDAEIVESKAGEAKVSTKGALNVNTRYLILGEMTTEKPASADRIPDSVKLMNEAKRLNVETIGLQKFLGMMGYTPRSSAAGGEAAPAGAAGADDNGFRPRKPPARAKDDSAF